MARSFDRVREIDRIFGEVARTTNSGVGLDLYRTGDRFIAEFDLPGVSPDSIDIDIDERTLTVRAERKGPELGEDGAWLVRERPAGTVARQLTLGRGVAADKVTADYRNGVLILTIPVAEEAKPRKIVVRQSSDDIVGDVDTETTRETDAGATPELTEHPA